MYQGPEGGGVRRTALLSPGAEIYGEQTAAIINPYQKKSKVLRINSPEATAGLC